MKDAVKVVVRTALVLNTQQKRLPGATSSNFTLYP